MLCPYCGQPIEKKDKEISFCPYCGGSIAPPAPATAPVTAVPAPVPTVSAATALAAKEQKPPKKKKGKKVLFAVIAVICALAILAGALWFALGKNGKKEEEKEQEKETAVLAIEDISIEDRDIQTYEKALRKVSVQVKEGETYTALTVVNASQKSFGTVKDDGANGDDVAGDGIYSGMLEFYSEEAEPMDVYVAADGALSDKSETVYFYPEYKEEYYDQYEDVSQTVEDTIALYDDENLEQAHNEVMQLLSDKKAAGEIADFRFEGLTIVVMLNSGATYVYTYNPGGEFEAGTTAVAPAEEMSVEMYTVSPNVNKVISLQPYYHEMTNDVADKAARTVASSQYNYSFSKNADNTDVNIELMKNLNQYQVIVLHGHGGYDTILHSFFGIGTRSSAEVKQQNWSDFYYDRLISLSGGQYGVTSAFFDRYYDENAFGDTIIYLGCCHGADDNVLADTLLSKGVDAVYAFTKGVYTSYDLNMMATIFEELAKKENNPVTVAEALKRAKNKHGEKDSTRAHWYNVWPLKNYEAESLRAELCLFTKRDNVTLSVQDSYIRGKIADADSDTPLRAATVSAYSAGTDKLVLTGRADQEGNFALSLQPGIYDLVVNMVGYLPCSVKNIRVSANSTTYLQKTILLSKKEETIKAVVGGSVYNAVTGEGVEGVSISFRKEHCQLDGDYVKDSAGNVITITSDENGTYYTENLEYGYYTAEFTKEGYVIQYLNVVATNNNDVALHQDTVFSPEAHGSDFRITLQWEANPRDEDAHIVGEGFHVYFSKKNAYDDDGNLIANLDHDDTQGNGFETITLTVDPTKTYQYYVYHYAGTGSLSTSNAFVTVYQGGVMIKQYSVPVDQGTGRYWNVFNIVDGKVISLNRISDSSEQ